MIRDKFQNCLTGPWRTAGQDTQYKLVENGDEVELYFAGSSSDLDWRDNFSAWIAPYKDQPVKWYAHAGFVRAWKAAREQIFYDVMEVYKGYLCIFGYSHGGAIATLAHEDFHWHAMEPLTNVFGAPRAIWWTPAAIKARFEWYHRYALWGDIVTLSPPWLSHVGTGQTIGPWRLPSHLPHYPERYMEALPC
jgi:hypothetical protein